MGKKVQSVRFNFIMNAILTCSSFVFPLITFPYISRTLGASQYGVVTFAQSVVSYFTMFSSLGIPTYGIRACAKVRDDKDKLSKTVHELLIINTICTIVVYVAFTIALFSVERLSENRELLIVCSFSIVLNTVGVQWLFSALEQYRYITTRNICFKIASIILMFLFVHSPQDYIIYAAIALVGNSLSYILNFVYMRKYVTLKRYQNYNLRQHLKPIFVFFAMSVSINIYTNLDSVMLGFMSTDAQVGYYSAAIKLKNVLVSLVRSLGTVLLPRMMYYVGKGMKDAYYRSVKKAFQFIIAVATPMTVFFMYFAYESIVFLSGVEYAEATGSMQVLMLTLIFIGLSGTISDQILLPNGKEKEVCVAVTSSAAFDYVLNLFLIPKFAALGAAISTTLAELMSLCIQAVFARTYLKEILKGIKVGHVILSVFMAFIASFLINSFIDVGVFLTLLINAIMSISRAF